jgi:hypothetical protein
MNPFQSTLLTAIIDQTVLKIRQDVAYMGLPTLYLLIIYTFHHTLALAYDDNVVWRPSSLTFATAWSQWH